MVYEWVALGVAVAGLAAWLVKAWPVCSVLRHGRFLADGRMAELPQAADLPRVSVIVPACDEQEAIRQCLESLAGQDYPNLEIIAVDDRSTDRTGAIMDEVAAADPRVRVEHVRELPPGWIGKNHANALGAERATGDWLLFTDGDVIFEPACLRRALAHAEAERLDHLALFPGLAPGGYWEQAACCFFGVMISMVLQTWHARNPLRAGAFCGIGAFNLVRRAAYKTVGGHEPLRMEVADDIMLGKLLKRGGFVSDLLSGRSLLTVRWQVGLGGVIRGLEKNAFCGTDYSIIRAAGGVLALTALALLPLAGTIFAPGWTRVAYAAWLASEIGALSIGARGQRMSRWLGPAFPVVSLALSVAIARSTVLTLWRGGIRWRGTFYPLDALRREHLKLTAAKPRTE